MRLEGVPVNPNFNFRKQRQGNRTLLFQPAELPEGRKVWRVREPDFRPGGNAGGVRRKGQRVRASSTERTHNARHYATLPGPEQASPRACAGSRRGHARLGAASSARSMTPDSMTSRTTRSGTHKAEGLQGEVDGDAVGGNGRLALMAWSAR